MNLNSRMIFSVAVSAAAVTGLFAGLLGGFLAARLGGPSMEIPKNLTVESLNAKSIVTRSFVAETDEEGVECQIGGGSIVASKAIVGARLAGNVLAAKSIIASDKPTTARLEEQKIVAELAAMPDCGGVLILRNQEGANTPATGPVKAGQAIFLGYAKGGTPMAYTQDIPRGLDGRSFFVRAVPGNGQPMNAQAGNQPQPPEAAASQGQTPAVADTNRVPQVGPAASSPESNQPLRGFDQYDPSTAPSMATPGGDTLRR